MKVAIIFFEAESDRSVYTIKEPLSHSADAMMKKAGN